MTAQIRNMMYAPAPHHPVPAFQSLLALGAMLAALAVVAYAFLSGDDSAMRARLVLQGAGVILMVWLAGLIASGLHLLATADEAQLAEPRRLARA
jgi:hypothetical protein